MSAKRRGLGRGLDALIPAPTTGGKKDYFLCPIEQIVPRADQPRQSFDQEALVELSQSVREQGIIQPLVVRRLDQGFEIIAGERRYQAAAAMLRDLGLTRIRLMTNNPEKVAALRAEGIELVDHMTLHSTVNPHNERYLQAKRKRAGHL